MLDAVPSGIYDELDELIVANAFTWLTADSQKYDMIISFGVFAHFAESEAKRMIELIAERVNEGSLFAFDAAEIKERYIHALPAAAAIPMISGAGLEPEAMVRRNQRTTFVCRKY